MPDARAARAATTGRIEGTVTLVSPGGAPVQSGAYPSRRVTRPAAPPSELANVVIAIKDPPAGRRPVADADDDRAA